MKIIGAILIVSTIAAKLSYADHMVVISNEFPHEGLKEVAERTGIV